MIEEKCCCLDQENDEHRYQTLEGEENVESTSGNEVEQSGTAIEVIETSHVIQFSQNFI
jgi:hypothetical protein